MTKLSQAFFLSLSFVMFFGPLAHSSDCNNPLLDLQDVSALSSPSTYTGEYCSSVLQNTCCPDSYFSNLDGDLDALFESHKTYFLTMLTDMDAFIDHIDIFIDYISSLDPSNANFYSELIPKVQDERGEFPELRIECYDSLWDHHVAMLCLTCDDGYADWVDSTSTTVSLNVASSTETDFVEACQYYFEIYEELEGWADFFDTTIREYIPEIGHTTTETLERNQYLDQAYDLLECGHYSRCSSLLVKTLKPEGTVLDYTDPYNPLFIYATNALLDLNNWINDYRRLSQVGSVNSTISTDISEIIQEFKEKNDKIEKRTLESRAMSTFTLTQTRITSSSSLNTIQTGALVNSNANISYFLFQTISTIVPLLLLFLASLLF